MSGSSARRAWIVLLTLLLPGCAGGQAREAGGEPIVGGPCEGCEAVFVGMPEAIPSHARIAPPDEPGEALRIEGRVLRPDGRPAPGVVVYAYQTNAEGIYPRDQRLRGAAARHGALRGWARADDEGRYGFDTVRPGGYPGSDMPQHIHMHVLEPGRCTYYIDDVVFRDDPRLTDEKLASYSPGRGGSGVVVPRPSGPSAWIATRDIVLGEKIPGYPPLGPMDTPKAREDAAPARAIDPSSLDDTFLITEPEWSRDGDRILFAGGAWPDLDVYALDVTGGEVLLLFAGAATDYMPSGSPDGERVVFASTRNGSHDLFVGPAGGGPATPLSMQERCDDTEPRWSPDGEWIAFRSDCDGNREVYKVRPDGSERTRLTRRPDEDGEPSWTPDGSKILFTSYRDGQPEVYLMEAGGSGLRRLTTTPGGHSRRAEASPDGGRIAFGSNRDGDEEIYLMRWDGSGIHNLSRHPAREYYSRWSPDGSRLVFTSNRERERNALYATSPDGQSVERLFPPD
ncbi:MAG: hypothetical protein OES32_08150 [Acidobacteriota bacterium]|nr:hypothetical protein [Acidobacteriota bacterium]MDH3523545.1 hypothetical protein [Acidobacteriota bacterium]